MPYGASLGSETMEKINEMITWLLILIPVGSGARILYCLAAMPVDEDAVDSYRKRIKNILVFVAIAESLTGILKAVAHYYGG